MADIDDTDVTLEPEDGGQEERLDAKLKKLRDELKAVKKERDDYLAGWQRSKADYVNLSRRVREQEADTVRTGRRKIAEGMIAVFDSLEAAYTSAEKEGGAVFEGLRQVGKQLEAALAEHGITRFAPKVGDVCDPGRHEPVTIVATDSKKEDNVISATLQSGYEVDGMVVRPARVAVKKYA